MRMPFVSRMAMRLKLKLRNSPDRFFGDVSGVVHVGANTGQERKLYGRLGLRVLWIEPIPEVFAVLEENLRDYPSQRAVQSLVTDKDGAEYRFNVASNNGASSSILELAQHKDIWPQVHFTKTLILQSVTLATLFEREHIDASAYQALVMDTQGSELLVLQGAVPTLRNFKYIKTEVPDFESYAGCCQLKDIEEFMFQHGFEELSRNRFASRSDGGNYFDIVFKRPPAPAPGS